MSDAGATIANPTPTTVLPLTSAQTGQEYTLFVSLPADYESSGRTYPVLYVLDGNGLFTFTRQTVEVLQIKKEVPELIIVGVGYPSPTYMDTLQLRGRDLTFEDFKPDPDSTYPWGETGGARAFLDVLTNEIMPLIERTYRIDPQDRGLFGWSMSGDFAHRIIYLCPGLLQRVIVIDAYDEKAAELAELPYLTPPVGRLFLGYADATIPAEWIAPVQRHIEAVKASGARAAMHVFPGENHFSVVPAVISRGLRENYAH